jgi:putative cardiolipin synthase
MFKQLRYFGLVVVFAVTAGCASIDFDYPKSESTAFTDTGDTRLGRAIADPVAAHRDKAGFYPLLDGVDALALRWMLAERAERSIDVQYFLIHVDVVGRVFIESLLRAADRGVRVRLLIDDIHTGGHDANMAALDSHPNFEVRVFNPFAARSVRALNAPSMSRVIRRMHNKSFTVDNQMTIIGGRNIGDEYFGARSDVNFGDLDVLGIGPVVQEVSSMFDTYWNHRAALPILALTRRPDNPEEALDELRTLLAQSRADVSESRYAAVVQSIMLDAVQRDVSTTFTWAPYDLVFDSPDKWQPGSAETADSITTSIRDSLIAAQQELLVITPYFVLRDREIEEFRQLRNEGIEISVLTNSLASNNHTISHSGYLPLRKPMLEMGVKLYEMRADAGLRSNERVGTEMAKTTLHIKAFTVDRRWLFIGSFNWNQRSENIDTEMGVIIDSPELAERFAEQFNALDRDRTYELFLNDDGKLRWRGEENGQEVILTKEPQTGFWQRFSAGFLRTLPIKSQL